MTLKKALETIRDIVYRRITRTCPYVTDEGILVVVNNAISEAETPNKGNVCDILIKAEKVIENLRMNQIVPCNDDCSACYNVKDCKILAVKTEIQRFLENPESNSTAILKMTETLQWIRDKILGGELTSSEGQINRRIVPEIVNRCDMALTYSNRTCYGGIARMRKVLRRLKDFLLVGYPGSDSVKVSGKDYHEMHRIINEALSEPIRVSEIYNDYDSAYAAYCKKHHLQRTTDDFVYWLLNETVDGTTNENDLGNYNISKMRKALEKVYAAFNSGELRTNTFERVDGEMRDAVADALLSPHRNCDKYPDLKKAKLAYKAMVNASENALNAPTMEEWLYMEAR